MSDRLIGIFALAASLGCGVVGGTFFAFSTFVMPALSRLPAAQGIAAMQSINAVILRSAFMPAFMGTALVCALVAALAILRWQAAASPWLLAGGVLYLAGVIGVTLVFNVPRNDALAALGAGGDVASWEDYVATWTAWNHVRAAAAIAAMGALVAYVMTPR